MLRIRESQEISDLRKFSLPYRELPGLSANLLSNHYKLYEGYLQRLNALKEPFQKAILQDDKWTVAMIAREREFLTNAVILHELYFEELTPGGRGDPGDVVHPDLAKRWEREFKILGKGATGWVVLSWDPKTYTFMDFVMKDHGTGYVAGTIPLLVMDVYEHAYMPDYGLDKEAYINTFFKNINWNLVRERFRKAVGMKT